MLAAKWKLASIASVLCLGLVGYFIYMTVLDEKSAALKESITIIHQLNTDLLMLRRYEKDFLSRYDQRYLLLFEENAEKLKSKVNRLKDPLSHYEHIGHHLGEISSSLERYYGHFMNLYKLQESIGLTAEVGTKGALSQLEKNIEGLMNEFDQPHWLKEWYYIVKLEKTYLLNPTYHLQVDFNHNVDTLARALRSHITSESENRLLRNLLEYQYTFNHLAQLFGQKGTNSHEGMQKTLGSAAHELEHRIGHLLQMALDTALSVETHHEHQTKTMMIFFPLVVLFIALMPFFFFLFSPQDKRKAA